MSIITHIKSDSRRVTLGVIRAYLWGPGWVHEESQMNRSESVGRRTSGRGLNVKKVQAKFKDVIIGINGLAIGREALIVGFSLTALVLCVWLLQ